MIASIARPSEHQGGPSPPAAGKARRPSPFRWFATCVLAAVVVGLLDVVIAAARAPAPDLMWGALLPAGFAAIGLYSVPAALLGLLQVLVVDSLHATIGPRPARWLVQVARHPEADLRLGGGLLASLCALLLLTALVYAFGRGVAVEMANKRNTALSTALFAAAAVPVCAVLALPAYRLLRPLLARLPRPRSLWALALLLLGGVLVSVLALLSVDWRAIPFGPAKVLLGLLLTQTLLLWAQGRGPLWRDQPRWLRRSVVASLALLCICATLFTFTRFGAEPHGRVLVGEQAAGGKFLLRLWRMAVDRDRDGYSPILGGGDCNDRDPAVHPGGIDAPGDGVDQDCDGADEPAVAAPVAPQRPEPPARQPPSLGAAAPARRGPFPNPAWDGNWLFITVDTLRADRITPTLTPRMAALADRGARFTSVYAQAPNTPRSFPSVLTSRFPSQVHFVRQSLNFSPVTGKDPTIFTMLAEAGYRNIGVFSHFYMDQKSGLTRGFDEWQNSDARTLHDSNSDIASPRIARRVVERLLRLGAEQRAGTSPKPFVLWTHLFDPHSTYMDHPEFPVAGKGMRYLAARYDAEVAFTDRHVGQVLDGLQQAGLAERTAVVIFSDHGEAFGEHKLGGEPLYFHGETLYDEVLKVPLILFVPGMRPQVVDDRVMLIDLAPTVLELAHVPAPASFRGRSLVGRLHGQPLPPMPAYAEMLPCTSWQYNQRALISGPYKLYAKFTENLMELYDLREDPQEQHNLAGRMPGQVQALRQQLAGYLREGRPDVP